MVFEDDPLRDGSGLRVGYFQSKWVSERLVMAAGQRGIPGCIYRPSLITGHTVTGDCKLDDLLPLMIQGCIRLGLAPSFEDLVIDFLPVDVLSRIIVHLSGRPDSMGKAFNLVNPGRLPWPRLFDIIRSLGYSVQAIPYREWLDALRTSSSSNALVQMLPFFDRMDERLFASPRLDSRNMQEGLAGIDLGIPPVEELFQLYLGYFARMGLIPAPGVREHLASAGGAD
jgi:thioester reductase-like protein